MVGFAVVGEAVVGEAVVGEAVVGEAVVGEAVVGEAVVGDSVVGEAVVGEAVVGEREGAVVGICVPCIHAQICLAVLAQVNPPPDIQAISILSPLPYVKI